ncbi:MAG: MAPEG family protein [Waterburya sp.]
MSPPNVSNPSDNLKNLFEIPVLFYALVLYLFVTKQVDTVYINAGWCFVVFRVLHSAVHCTFNLIILRFYLYLFSTLAVWFIALRAALTQFI